LHRLIARARRAQQGFTLVEVMVSMLLLGGGIFAAAGAFENGSSSAATSQRIDVATATATRALEELRALPYAQVSVSHAAGAPASLGADDPRSRIVTGGTQYQVPGGPKEDLVDNQASAPPDYERVTVGTGNGAITMKVFRFVSWRDEECPIVDLSQLNSLLGGLLTTLTTTNNLLGGLLGPGGSLTGAIAQGNGVLGSIPVLNLVLGALTAPVKALVNNALTPIATLLTPLVAPLQGTLTKLNSLLDPVTHKLKDTIDLCDMPPNLLPDLAQVSVLKTALTALNPVLVTLSSTVDTVSALLSLNLVALVTHIADINSLTSTLTGLLAQLTPLVNSALDTAGHPAQVVTLATSLTTTLTKLGQFLATPNTTHNTKRVSVAVWIERNGVGYAPNKPLWVSGVITDPAAGI
jgi:prepilin-type N-terminal cleavage/methylation domain-containing protein